MTRYADEKPPTARELRAVRETERAVMRDLADMAGIWEHCGREKCFHARACRDRGVACFDEWRKLIRDVLLDAAHYERLDGPYDDERYAEMVFEHRRAERLLRKA